MTCISLDLATVCGWAIGKFPVVPLSPLEMIVRKPPKPLSGVWRNDESAVGPFLLKYERWLTGKILEHGVTAIIFESPVLPSGGKDANGKQRKGVSIQTARKLMGLAGITQMVAHRLGIKWTREAAPSSVKFYFCGSGRPGKDGIMEMCDKLSWQYTTDDEADALALHCFGSDLFYRERLEA